MVTAVSVASRVADGAALWHRCDRRSGMTAFKRALWVTLAALLLVALPRVAAALDCQGMMPLPDDVRVVPPAPDVPQDLARFSGAWSGAWRDAGGVDTQCNTLVIEEVHANGFLRVVYSVGASPRMGSGTPYVARTTARLADGALRFVLPTALRSALAYRFDGNELAGTFEAGGSARLRRRPDAGDVAALRCDRPASPTSAPQSGGARDRLTASELSGSATPDGPVHNDYFMPVGAPTPARHTLRGLVTVAAGSLAGRRDGCAIVPRRTPAFSFAVFSEGEHLVPVARGDIVADAIILGPGRVWSEPGDGGLSRGSFPFTMVNPLTNSAHNGLATFVFDEAHVSALRVQLVQETAPWSEVDLWGRLHVTYTPGPIADEAAARAAFTEEVRRQTPIRPWSALGRSAALDAFDGDAAPAEISANGMVADGVLYLRGCNTRQGPYPYCRAMRHGVFSVTKSAAGAIALLRLAQKYGDAVLDEKLVDYLPPGLAHAGWNNVTFGNLLDMATGIGDEGRERDDTVYADENRPKMVRWVRLKSAREKIQGALDYGTYPWGPGAVLRYNSTQTFLLAAAMDAYLKRREGPGAHLWDMVRREVFEPIGIAHAPKLHTIEADGSRGIPLLGYGLYLTVDDVAKLTTLLQNGGRHDGTQLLSPTVLARALFRSSATAGLPNTQRNRFGEGRYSLSFWSVAYTTATGCAFQIPYMAGLGGNLVALLPNGVSVFRFSDADHFDLDAMILAGESIRPFCGAIPPTTRPAPLAALTSAELAAEVPGHTFTVGRQQLHFASGGRLYGRAGSDANLGTWAIEGERLCRTWTTWDHGIRRCYVIVRDGDAYVFDMPQRFARFPARRTAGGFAP
jgi:hypothetical protein